MVSVHNAPCIICSKQSYQTVFTTTWPEHRYPGSFTLLRCTNCGLLFNSPRLDDKELAALYGRNYYFFARGASRELRRIPGMYQRTLGPLVSNIANRRILDVGCGRGYFPGVLSVMGWDAHGVEISEEAAEFARENFDIDVFTGTIEQYAAQPRTPRFPVVTAIDVIEHVPHPDSFVAALAKVTEIGGTLIIDTPNGSAHNAEVAGKHWKGFNPFHIYLFNIANLTQLLNRHGFQVRTSYSYGNWPLDRGGQSLPAMLADRTARLLRATGLIGPVARSFFALRRITMRSGNIPRLVEKTVQRIHALPPLSTLPDTIAPLARHALGDNIVVVARRVTDKPSSRPGPHPQSATSDTKRTTPGS